MYNCPLPRFDSSRECLENLESVSNLEPCVTHEQHIVDVRTDQSIGDLQNKQQIY